MLAMESHHLSSHRISAKLKHQKHDSISDILTKIWLWLTYFQLKPSLVGGSTTYSEPLFPS